MISITTDIKFINSNGETFNFSIPNYALQQWEGFESVKVSHKTTKAPYQDGETLIDSVFESKQLSLQFEIQAETRALLQLRRRIVSRYFNPKLGLGKLVYTDDNGNVFHLDCIVEDIIMPGGDAKGPTWQQVLITFIAPNPFWYDPNILTSYLVGFAGGLSFPFSFPLNFGTVGTQITINNSGNVDTPILITFSGEITDPVITNNTTGESITIIKTINDGDTLIINTAFGSKSVQISSGGVYSNAFEYVDPSSKFWQLVPGENDISYSATSEGANAKGQLQYYQRYSGV